MQDCSTTEQLSMCAISQQKKNEVCEEFIGFVKLEKLDAQTIVDTLLHALQECGFNMSRLVGQRYDGASSSRNGVQAKVAEKYPNARYVHCRSHVSNLQSRVVTKLCNPFRICSMSANLVVSQWQRQKERNISSDRRGHQ